MAIPSLAQISTSPIFRGLILVRRLSIAITRIVGLDIAALEYDVMAKSPLHIDDQIFLACPSQ